MCNRTIALAGLDTLHQSAMSPSSISPSLIASVCSETVVDQMVMTQSSSPTRVASEASLVCLLQPRLLQDGLPWDKVKPLLEKCKHFSISMQEAETVCCREDVVSWSSGRGEFEDT
jgi:hypothetical protein